jgi:hypothetical protein
VRSGRSSPRVEEQALAEAAPALSWSCSGPAGPLDSTTKSKLEPIPSLAAATARTSADGGAAEEQPPAAGIVAVANALPFHWVTLAVRVEPSSRRAYSKPPDGEPVAGFRSTSRKTATESPAPMQARLAYPIRKPSAPPALSNAVTAVRSGTRGPSASPAGSA